MAGLGDVMIAAIKAAPPDFPLVDLSTVREYEYGLRLDEVTVDFDADLEVSLAPSTVQAVVDPTEVWIYTGDEFSGEIVADGEETTIHLSAVRLRCVAQVRSEHEHAEITEIAIGLVDGWRSGRSTEA